MQPHATTPVQPRYWRTLTILFALLLLLVLLPILRADRYFSDDVARAITGFYGWDLNGRQLTTLVMRLLQFNLSQLVDISPLPQILAIAVLATTGALIARRYRIESPWLAALIAFPLGAQPFYLENLSYRFDALSMSLALFTALLPFLSTQRNIRSFVLGTLAMFASLCFYQPGLSAFLIFALMETTIAQIEEQEPSHWLRTLGWRVTQCVTAVLAYQVFVAPTIDDWLKQHTATIHNVDELRILKANAENFYGYMIRSFNIHWLRCAGPLLLLAAAVPVATAFRYVRRRPSAPRWQNAAWVCLGMLMPMLVVLAVTLPMLPLRDPVVLPRVLMGVGVLLCAGMICGYRLLRAWGRPDHWMLAYAGIWALGMASFAAIYGNALAAQKALEERVAFGLSNDIATLAVERPIHFILIDGSVGLAPVTARASQKFPLISTLIFPYLREADFHTAYFLRYYLQDTPELAREPGAESRIAAILARACTAPVEHVSRHYSLRVVEDVVVATFPANSHPKGCS